MTSSGCRGAHILVFPYPAQGHMLPLLDLTHQLIIHGGLTITILVTPKNLPILNPLLSKHPLSIQTLILPFPNHPSIPQGIENVKDLPPNYFPAMMRAMSELHYPILHWFKSHPSPPVAILSDFFLGWTHHLASELGIPRIAFSSSAAITLSITSSLWRDLPTRENPNDPNFLISFPQVPNYPKYPWWQISPVYRFYKQGDPDSELIRNGMLGNLASWGIVFNSFDELERVYLDHMKTVIGHQRVWGVGPLLPPTHEDEESSSGPTERGGSNSVAASDVLLWLDTCDDRSVVYICFGSQAVLNNKQMKALATGLELSGVRFVWSVKEATIGHVSGDYGVVPTGFEDRVKGRGLVIRGWAPQVLILRHRSVGTFLSHIGWNSVMEAVAAGVPILAWPMMADQFMNATLLVDQIGIGTKVCEGANTVPDAAELARVMKESVSENSGSAARAVRTVQLSKAALHATKGGSSLKDLDALVVALCGLNLKKSTEPNK